MATRATVRGMVRARLGDAGATVWDDAALNEAIAEALREYGARFPKERTAAIAVPAGAKRVALPAEAGEGARVLRVRDGAERPVARWPGDEATAAGAAGAAGGQAWRAWDGGLTLAEPAAAGTWQVEYLAARPVPVDDVTPVDVLPGDEGAVALLATAWALERRAVEEAVRGVAKAGAAAAAVEARRSAGRYLAGRRRRARLA